MQTETQEVPSEHRETPVRCEADGALTGRDSREVVASSSLEMVRCCLHVALGKLQ